jgi:hypothetical protein
MPAAADAAAQQAPLPAGTPAEEVERLQVGFSQIPKLTLGSCQ